MYFIAYTASILHPELLMLTIYCRKPMVCDRKTAVALPTSTWKLEHQTRVCHVVLVRLDPLVISAFL